MNLGQGVGTGSSKISRVTMSSLYYDFTDFTFREDKIFRPLFDRMIVNSNNANIRFRSADNQRNYPNPAR